MNGRKLQASDRPTHVYSYAVRGRGYFPLDMLRYDQAWPVDTLDLAVYTAPLTERVYIRLRSFHPPTEGRWNSFGWEVIEEAQA